VVVVVVVEVEEKKGEEGWRCGEKEGEKKERRVKKWGRGIPN